MGAMLGSGIFVLPGVAVGYSKEALALAYLISGLIVLPAALCKCELATALPRSGGTYLYVDRSVGPLAGTVVGLGTWFSLVFKSAFALVGLGAYCALLFDLSAAALTGISLAICAGLMVLNIVGVKKSTKVQTVVVAIALLALTIFVLASAPEISTERLARAKDVPFLSILACSGMVFVSFAGVTKVCSIAEEVVEPNKNLPRGILASLGLICLIYVLVSLVLTSSVDVDVFKGSKTPISTAAASHLGSAAASMIAVVAVLTLTSMANAGLLTSSRYPLAMARDRLLPDTFAKIHPSFRTPVPGVLLTGSLMLVLIWQVDVVSLAKLASAFQLLVFGLVNLTVIFIRESGARWYKPGFTVPGYPVTPLLGFAGSASLLAFMGPLALGGAVGIVSFGLLWYLLYARKRVTRQGALTRLYGERARVSSRFARPLGAGQLTRTGALVPVFQDEDGQLDALIPLANLVTDEGERLEVLRIEELPDQAYLADFDQDDERTATIRGHVDRIEEETGLSCVFEDVLTHNAKHALYERAIHGGADWIVMPWHPRSPWRVFVPDPVAWFIHHPPCNLLLFREARGEAPAQLGIRRFRRVLVLAEPGPHDVQVMHVADRLAEVSDGAAELTLVHLVPADATPEAEAGTRDYHEHLRKLSRSEIGEPKILRTNDDVAALEELARGFDLLVLGAPPASEVRGALRGSFEDLVTERVPCAVLRVKAINTRPHAALTNPARTASLPDQPDFSLSKGLDHVELVKEPLRTKASLFSAMGRSFSERLGRPLERSVEAALWERERKQVTALTHGVAIPHHTGLNELERVHVELWLMDRPVDFKGGHDVEPVDVCFLVLGPTRAREQHLRVLARIARLALQPGFLEGLRAAGDPTGVRAYLETCENALDEPDATAEGPEAEAETDEDPAAADAS